MILSEVSYVLSSLIIVYHILAYGASRVINRHFIIGNNKTVLMFGTFTIKEGLTPHLVELIKTIGTDFMSNSVDRFNTKESSIRYYFNFLIFIK